MAFASVRQPRGLVRVVTERLDTVPSVLARPPAPEPSPGLARAHALTRARVAWLEFVSVHATPPPSGR